LLQIKILNMAPSKFTNLLNRILSNTIKEHDFKISTVEQNPENPLEFICKMKSGKVYKGFMLDIQFKFKQDLIDSIFYHYQVTRICQEISEEPRLHNRLTAFLRYLSRFTDLDYYLYHTFSKWRKILYIANLRKQKIRWEEV
jgi:hypothetical protein